MTTARRARYLPLSIAALLAVPLLQVSIRVAAGMGIDRAYEIRYLPEGKALSFLSPGAKLSIANAYWLATVQYIGDQHLNKGDYEELYPLVDLVTDLDPLHGYAFQTGGIVLSTTGRLEESDRILKKGMEQGPNWWTYPFYLAFNDYYYRGNYESASRWAGIAARTPGASTNIAHLALSLEVKGGDPEAGLALVQELLKTTDDDTVRERLEEQEKLARLQVHFARLDASVATYTARHGSPPARLESLVSDGLMSALPVEPFGGRYELLADGKVHSTGNDFRFRPREPGRLQAPPATGRGAASTATPTPAPWRPPDFLEPRP